MAIPGRRAPGQLRAGPSPAAARPGTRAPEGVAGPPALGPQGVELARAGIAAAVAAGVPVSFDCNFREKLWGAWDSDPRAILLELLSYAI